MKTDLFQSCGLCWVFQICWHIEHSTFTASSFRIWNRSTEIPSHLLALFVVTLPKAHLTSTSRMSGSRWVITPLWLSGSWRSFLYSSFVYSCHLLISSAFVNIFYFCPLLCPSLVSPIFLERFLVFPVLLFSSISLHWSLRKVFLSLYSLEICIQMGISFLFLLCLLSLFFSQLFVRPPQTTILPFFLGGWSWSLPTVHCHEPPSIVRQALFLI